MKAVILCLFFAVRAVLADPSPSPAAIPVISAADIALDNFTKHPSARGLAIVTKFCRSKSLSSDALTKFAPRLKENSSIIGIQALLRFRQLCAEGDLALNLNAWIGIDVLTQNPASLVQALTLEQTNPVLIAELAEATGPAKSTTFQNCTSACLGRLYEFYRKKTTMVRSLKMTGPTERVKNRILQSIDAAKRKWKEDLGG